MKSIAFNIPFTRQFFSGYLIDHFLYKQYTLYNALELAERRVHKPSTRLRDKIHNWLLKRLNFISLRTLKGLTEIDHSAYAASLRLEIRATYFQAIETLFELIFSLEPRSNVIDNRQIWYFLSTSQWRNNYKRIQEVAKSQTAFLDREITAGKDLKVPFIQYLFYFGVTNPKMLDAVKASFGPIKQFLVEFAKEFSDHNEYNAFKHALRIFPTLQKVEIGPDGSDKPIVTLDMSNSMTYLVEKDESVSFHTKALDTPRDMRMTQVCSYLISNVVRSRRAHFTKNLEGHLHTFSDESFPSANKRDPKWADFKFTLTPIYPGRDKAAQSGVHRAGV